MKKNLYSFANYMRQLVLWHDLLFLIENDTQHNKVNIWKFYEIIYNSQTFFEIIQ